jgi:tripartite-type tricarboxylate transporter receptor subunit TctC
MRKIRGTIFVLGVLFLFLWGTLGMAADFPQRPIRLIIPYGPGGTNDVFCRAFQPAFEKALGQRILIETIPAGNTKVGTMELMNAKPDGYTLLFISTLSFVANYYGGIYGYKPWEKLSPIALVVVQNSGLLEVRAESPFKTWADLVKAAKESPGKLTCAGPGAGGFSELLVNEINEAAGIKVLYVPFGGSGPTQIAMLGGHVDFRTCEIPDAASSVRAGTSRALAVPTQERMKAYPGVPTYKELGLGKLLPICTAPRGFWAPPNLPSNLANTLANMIEKAMKDPEFVKIAQDQLLYDMFYLPTEKMKTWARDFDKLIGPKFSELVKK